MISSVFKYGVRDRFDEINRTQPCLGPIQLVLLEWRVRGNWRGTIQSLRTYSDNKYTAVPGVLT